jgi:hypothetical protein
MAVAEPSSDGNVDVPTTVIVLIVAVIVYSFGYVRARLHAANNAYKNTKKAVKPLRKAYWAVWRRAALIGAFALLAFGLLFTWMWHNVNADNAGQPVPASSVEPSPSRR